MAQQTKKTVAIACTSGTAVLNYAPAIAEAYYQKIPLLILTADRPKELIDQGDGQTIRQNNVYANYIKKSFELPEEINSEQVEKLDWNVNIIRPFVNNKFLNKDELDRFAKTWNESSKKLLIVGMMDANPELKQVLNKITDDDSVVLLAETTSNLNGDDCLCSCIDKVVSTFTKKEIPDFKPDLLGRTLAHQPYRYSNGYLQVPYNRYSNVAVDFFQSVVTQCGKGRQ
jgi:2-succinyl-5-enolpyruvyl-6-hydroxy-3-cyclohexene-1-carboxylate synthase